MIGRPNVGKINTDELSDRTEDSDHIEQATDDEEPDPDSSDNRGRYMIVFVDRPRESTRTKIAWRIYGKCGRAHIE